MPSPSPIAAGIGEQDVYAATERGTAELKACGTSLSAAELEMLVLLDGKATVAQVAQSAGKPMEGALAETLRSLIRSGFVAPASSMQSGGLDFGGAFTLPSQSANKPGVGSLQQQGFFVRIARRPVAKREMKDPQRASVLVIDDDPDLNKLLRTYLMLEGFAVQNATRREEIVAAFRGGAPDLVLLDVQMPDADGFDVLSKIRQHPVLKTVPVIMLTGEATRGAVLKGLRAGVDGYVTKPFEPDLLIAAVKSVLGPPGAARSA